MRKLCAEARCPDPAVYRGRCQRHSRQRERATHRNKSFYNSKRWKLTRRKQLHAHPLCQWAGEEGHALAKDVDHIIPIEEGGDKWSFTNLQSLCASHHAMKTSAEMRGKGRLAS